MTNPARLTATRDAPALRLTISLVLAMLVWAAMLAVVFRLLAGDEVPVRAPDTIDMKLVEIEPPPAPAPSPPTLSRQAAEATTPGKPHRDVRMPARSATPAVPPHPATPPDAPAPEAQVTRALAPTASTTKVTEPAPAPAPNSSPANGAPSPDGAGNSPARVLAQPLPALPDDLREDAYRVVAVARFNIHADGTIDVELAKPTPNPRLNRVLLDALRTWRFAPATENGRPIESRQEVRVHFNVN